MNIIYISPNGFVNPHLFPTFQKTFAEHGHRETDSPQEATHCFIELISGEVKYDAKLRDVFDRQIPLIVFDNMEYGTMNGIIAGTTWFTSNPSMYFVRNYSKDVGSSWHFPFDWSYFPECDFGLMHKDDLFARVYDCCLLSVASPTRINIVDGIIEDGRLDLNYIFLDHTQRYSHEHWVGIHRMAKFFISADGGGFTNERPQQLFSIAPMIQNRSNHLMANPFTDMVNCIEIDEHPTKEDIDKILSVVNDKEKLYEIYLNGYNHVKTKMSEEANSLYVLNKIKEILGEC